MPEVQINKRTRIKKRIQKKSEGVLLGLAFFRKKKPLQISQLTDAKLLEVLTNPDCSQTVMNLLGGDLSKHFDIGDARTLEHYPGVGKAMALRLEIIAEITLRILGQREESQPLEIPNTQEVFMS
jgi:DNA repair protein RadC